MISRVAKEGFAEMTALGDKIAQHRERLGLSVQDLAVCSGLSKVHVRAFEEGTPMADNPTIATLAALSRALGVSPLVLAAAAFDDLGCECADASEAKEELGA